MEQTFFPVTRREAERSGIPYSSERNRNALFPSQLRELRKEKGVSQDVLSKTLGVSKSTIGLWETGDTLPDAKAIHDLSDYFGVSSDYLLCKTDVKCLDADLQSVCEYTGLSELSIENVKSFCTGSGVESKVCKVAFSQPFFVNKFLESPDLYKAMLFTFDAVESAFTKMHNIRTVVAKKEDKSELEKEFLDECNKYISEVSKGLDEYGMVVINADQAEEYSLMKAREYINSVVSTIFQDMEEDIRNYLENKLHNA